ncbi:MAG TPA: hypothetical protein VGP63_13460 [Planctomycetaceae bacterium]|jgi:hypothetical protein|nr:hypothetical protein [Planctomycetaceae bacterium]
MSKWTLISRGASLLVAALYLAGAVFDEGVKGLGFGVVLLFPLALIWFPEPIGSITGIVGRGYVSLETPPFFVALVGWFFLIGVPVIIGLLSQ